MTHRDEEVRRGSRGEGATHEAVLEGALWIPMQHISIFRIRTPLAVVGGMASKWWSAWHGSHVSPM